MKEIKDKKGKLVAVELEDWEQWDLIKENLRRLREQNTDTAKPSAS